MEAFYHLAWRGYPALGLTLLGFVVIVRAVRGERAAAKRHRIGTDARALAVMRAFRQIVLGVAFGGIAAGWQWQVPWLLALALTVGFEETFESSIDIAALTEATARPRVRV